jgi:hypothetical protein
MPEHPYPYRAEPATAFADRLEAQLLRRLDGRVNTTTEADRHAADRSRTAIDPVDARRQRRRRLVRVAAAAAAVAVIAVGVLAISQFPSEQDAAAAVRSALERQERIDAYEATYTSDFPDGRRGESGTVRVDGDDAEVDGTFETPDGRTESFTVTQVGELVYTSFGGEDVVSPRRPDDSIQPSIAELSRALRGVLDSADVSRVGREVVAGIVATRYDLELDERTRLALADPVLGFQPDQVVLRLTIWLADDYPRQVEWVLDGGEHTLLTFVSIGDDLDIVAPAGDFTFDPEPERFDD